LKIEQERKTTTVRKCTALFELTQL